MTVASVTCLSKSLALRQKLTASSPIPRPCRSGPSTMSKLSGPWGKTSGRFKRLAVPDD
jgi:hypothetical protein